MWISIHTPTKGATAEAEQGLQWLLYFNPHSHEGSDRALGQMKTNGRLFQSTLPRRERQLELEDIYDEIWISIHTPTKGATSHYPLPILNHLYFNPHSHEGSDFPRPVKSYERLNFNPHSHEGSDFLYCKIIILIYYFNPHSHEGSDANPQGKREATLEFQSTLPRRERHRSCKKKGVLFTISIHTPTKGATSIHITITAFSKISIHTPTKGATYLVLVTHKLPSISIHTPTKGATIIELVFCSMSIISIHTPTKGATASIRSILILSYFNPHSHEGSDITYNRFCFFMWAISIHTPTKGATKAAVILTPHHLVFQSTLPRRERHDGQQTAAKCVQISIHTPTKGATDFEVDPTQYIQFQSTLPRRERLGLAIQLLDAFLISIHTPTKGATSRQCWRSERQGISIHTPTKGATDHSCDILNDSGISIHTPTKGATDLWETFINLPVDFNPHSHEGSDKSSDILRALFSNFNPHSHEGSDSERHSTKITASIFQSTLPRRERQMLQE